MPQGLFTLPKTNIFRNPLRLINGGPTDKSETRVKPKLQIAVEDLLGPPISVGYRSVFIRSSLILMITRSHFLEHVAISRTERVEIKLLTQSLRAR